jgi:hypothetical protein
MFKYTFSFLLISHFNYQNCQGWMRISDNILLWKDDNSNMHVFLIQGVVLFFSWILKNHIFFLKFQNIFNYNLLWLNHMSFLIAFLDSLDNFLFRNVYFYGCRISNMKETINWMKNVARLWKLPNVTEMQSEKTYGETIKGYS